MGVSIRLNKDSKFRRAIQYFRLALRLPKTEAAERKAAGRIFPGLRLYGLRASWAPAERRNDPEYWIFSFFVGLALIEWFQPVEASATIGMTRAIELTFETHVQEVTPHREWDID